MEIKQVWTPIPNSSQELALDSRAHHTLYSGTRGPGKALPLTTPVPTPEGFIFHGSLEEGSEVYGLNGSIIKVLETYDTEVRKTYELSFNEQSSIRASDEHLWVCSIDRGAEKTWRVLSTVGIKDRIDKGQPVWLPPRPLVEYPHKELPIHPYMLGLWVGDGSASVRYRKPSGNRTKVRKGYSVEFGTEDLETVKFAQSQNFTIKRINNGFYWMLGKESHKNALMALGLFYKKSNEKFIPEEVMTNSAKVRLAFLRGLLDSDGTPTRTGARLATTSEDLANLTVSLVKSLGGVARVNKYYPRKEYRQKLPIFNVDLNFKDIIPFKLSRKVNKYKKPERLGWFNLKVTSVKYIGYEEVSCIKVDAADSVYIAGSDYIPTHNTDVQLMRFRRKVGIGYGAFWRGIIFDREYKNLEDLIAKSKKWFPKFDDGCQFKSSKSDLKWVWPTGEELFFRVAKTKDDYWNYHGHEYPWIGWNELTKYPTSEVYDMMMSVNRTSFVPEEHPISIDKRIWDEYGLQVQVPPDHPNALTFLLPDIQLEVFSTTNPYGVGHTWVKRKFIDPAPFGQIVREKTKVFDPRTQKEIEIENTQVAIHGSWKENKYLTAQYVATLQSEKDESRKAAWYDGSWDIVAGGAISDLWRIGTHIKPRFVIPESWYLDRCFDWGSTQPFYVGWFAEANGEEACIIVGNKEYKFCPQPGSIILFHEWYGTHEIGSNEGLKMSAKAIARGIKERENYLKLNGWIKSNINPGPADNSIRDVREVDVETIEDKMAAEGIRWTQSDKSPGSRRNGLQLIRDRLEAALERDGPGFYVMAHCKGATGTLPALPRSERDPDDVDTDAEDHPYDTIRYRMLGAGKPKAPKNMKIGFI